MLTRSAKVCKLALSDGRGIEFLEEGGTKTR